MDPRSRKKGYFSKKDQPRSLEHENALTWSQGSVPEYSQEGTGCLSTHCLNAKEPGEHQAVWPPRFFSSVLGCTWGPVALQPVEVHELDIMCLSCFPSAEPLSASTPPCNPPSIPAWVTGIPFHLSIHPMHCRADTAPIPVSSVLGPVPVPRCAALTPHTCI